VMHTGSPAAASSISLLRCAFASARLTLLTHIIFGPAIWSLIARSSSAGQSGMSQMSRA
jgi:hypothetical protein